MMMEEVEVEVVDTTFFDWMSGGDGGGGGRHIPGLDGETRGGGGSKSRIPPSVQRSMDPRSSPADLKQQNTQLNLCLTQLNTTHTI